MKQPTGGVLQTESLIQTREKALLELCKGLFEVILKNHH
jgi:hypothetical protein